MGLFKPDLYRNFVIGFLLGALVVVANASPDWEAEFSGKAYAAENDQVADAAVKAP
ncbi:MAG: hypothetical protein ABJ242_04215 [Marinomonas sp.]